MTIQRCIDALRAFWASPSWKDHARRRGLRPVMELAWERMYAVDNDGRVLCTWHSEWEEFHEETDRWYRHVVLAQAAECDPSLESLRPVRAPEDPDCDGCGGTGTRADSRQTCKCGGLGWLPHGVFPPYDRGRVD
jgi:hypothetical protein